MDHVLVAIAGPYAGRSAPLTQPEITFGRDSSNTLPLGSDPHVSRFHAKLYLQGSSWYLADLGSTNGTFAAGQRIGAAPCEIRPGTTFTIGASIFRIDVPTSTNAAKPPVAAPPVQVRASRLGPAATAAPRPKGRHLKEALQTYEQKLGAAMSRGALTWSEAYKLIDFQRELGLTDSDTHPYRMAQVARCIDQANASGVISAGTFDFELLHKLGVDGSADVPVRDALNRALVAEYTAMIQAGTLPVVEPGLGRLSTRPGEVNHIEVQAALIEEQVVDQRYVSGFSGIGFSLGGGTWIDFGGSSGRWISKTGLVPISVGVLAATSQRLAFLGNPISFDHEWAEIMGVEPYGDGIQFFIGSRATSPMFAYVSTEFAQVFAYMCSVYLSP